MRRLTTLLAAVLGLALLSAPVSAHPPEPGMVLVFADEFNSATVDRAKWTDVSSSQWDCGRGNQGNPAGWQSLEWSSFANAAVGQTAYLVVTARRQTVRSPCTGRTYGWTSALLSSRAFTIDPSRHRYYLEQRAMLPGPAGFWPAFWTWQAPGQNVHSEVDGYEFYSDNHGKLYFTVHYGSSSQSCSWPVPPEMDLTRQWHRYGALITAAGVQFYFDDRDTCFSPLAAVAPMSVVMNLAVYRLIPPSAGTVAARLYVDWVRVWMR